MKINLRKLLVTLAMALLLTLTTLVSLLKADTGTCGGANIILPFTDVTGNGFFCQIAAAYFSGLANGTTPTTYSPHDPVTREQMAAFTTRTLDQSLKRGSRRAALGQLWTPHHITNGAKTQLSQFPNGVASDGECLWVADSFAGRVFRVRASDGKLLDTWSAQGVKEVIVARGLVYAMSAINNQGQLYAIDPRTTGGINVSPGAISTNVGGIPHKFAYDGRYFYFALGNQGLSVFDPETGAVTVVTAGFTDLRGVVYDGANIWVADAGKQMLHKLGFQQKILKSVPVGVNPRQPVCDGTNLWVPNYGSSSVTVVRAATGDVLATLTGNGLTLPIAGAFDGERIVIVSENNDNVSLWKATELTPLGMVSTGTNTLPIGACSDGLNFWITLGNPAQLARL